MDAPSAPEESSDEQYWNFESHYPYGPRSSNDARLRRAATPGLRGLFQARATQALVWAPRLVAGGVRGRFQGGRWLSLRASRPGRQGDGHAWRLSRDRAARTLSPHGIV